MVAGGLVASTGACAERPGGPDGRVLRVGVVAPRTGALSALAAGDRVVIDDVRDHLVEGLALGGVVHPLDVPVADSGSTVGGAREATRELVRRGVDVIIASSSATTVVPVAALCEEAGVPCVTSMVPYEVVHAGLGLDPADTTVGPAWVRHLGPGADDVAAALCAMWATAPAAGTLVATVFAAGAAGSARGFAAALAAHGYSVLDAPPGGDAPIVDLDPAEPDFGPLIARFAAAGAGIVAGSLDPPDFAAFWRQTGAAGFAPAAVSVAPATLSAATVADLAGPVESVESAESGPADGGSRGEVDAVASASPVAEDVAARHRPPFGAGRSGVGLSTELWWSPTTGTRSSLTGASASRLGRAHVRAGGSPSTQTLGPLHAAFEVVVEAWRRLGRPGPPADLVAAIDDVRLATVLGPVSFADGPAPGVAATPVGAGQWTGRPEAPELATIIAPDPAASTGPRSLRMLDPAG